MTQEAYSPATHLERIFGVRNDAFRQYMGMLTLHQVASTELVGLSAQLAAHDHPLMQSAAGWAKAEAATNKPDFPRKKNREVFSAQEREQALNDAMPLWEGARDGFKALCANAKGGERKIAAWLLERRMAYAQATRPSMGMVARWRANEEPPLQEVESVRGQTTSAVVALGEQLLKYSPENGEMQALRAGMAYEVLVHLLVPDDYLVVSSSLRQDHHAEGSKRSDLTAFAAAVRNHPKRDISIMGHGGATRRSNRSRCIIAVHPNLHVYPGQSVLETLRQTLVRENGRLYRPDVREKLDAMSAYILQEVTAPVDR